MPGSEVIFSMWNSRTLSNESKASRRVLPLQVRREEKKFRQLLIFCTRSPALFSGGRALRASFKFSGELVKRIIAQIREVLLLPST